MGIRVNCMPKWAMQAIILTVGCLAYALTFFHRYAPSVLYEKIEQDLHIADKEISQFGSMYFWPYAFMQPIGGILADVFSPGKLIAIAQIIIAIGACIDGFSRNFGLSSFGRFLVGLGAGPIYVPASRLIASWFTDRGFVIASGILLASGAAGGMIAQGPLSAICDHIHWSNTFYAAGGLGVIVAIFAALLLKATPAFAGYIDDATTNDESTQIDVKMMSLKERLRQLVDNIKIVSTNKQFWLVAIWGICSPSCFFNFSSLWCGPYLKEVTKLSPSKANLYIMMLSLAWIIGSPSLMVFTELLKTRKWILVVSTIITCGTSVGFMFVTESTPVALLLPMLFIFALFAGATIGVQLAMFKEMHIDSAAATAMGCGNVFPFFTAGVLQLISPVLLAAIDKTGSGEPHSFKAYRFGLWMVNAIMAVIACIGISLSRDTCGIPVCEKAGYVDSNDRGLFSSLT